MPITGNLNQENPVLDEPEGQYVAIDNTQVTETSDQNQDFTGAEVSSTTVDPDPLGGSALTHSTVSGSNIEPVQSTSLDITSDFLEGFKESAPLKTTAPAPSSSFNKGFQDAFAAFASASYRDEEEEESAVDVPSEELATTVASKLDDVVSAAADSAGSAAIEPVVSSAIDSGLVTTSGESVVKSGQEADSIYAAQELAGLEQPATDQIASFAGNDADSQMIGSTQAAEAPPEVAAASDSVYFIQMTDASGQVVTSIIDPNDIPSYADSVVYKQCMLPDGEIETTIVYQGGIPVTQEEQPTQEQVMATEEASEQVEQQIIYVHDANGQLTPIDSAQSANDVAPPGKQFVYMQDSTGRIIRTIMDANQTMVPGQQVYYTQSEDGRIITSVMDSATAGVTEDGSHQTVDQLYQQQSADNLYQQQLLEEAQQQQLATSVVGATAGFNIDNSMSGLSMLAELSHLTAGQVATGVNTEPKTASSTESNSMDMDEFRPVAMVTRRLAGDEGDVISSEIAGLKVGETDSSSVDQDLGPSLLQEHGAGQEDSVVGKILSEMKIEGTNPSYSVSRDNLFVQWQNLDAMCWMDVVLIMLVYSPTLRPLVNLEPTHELASTLLITLLKANRQAQVLLQNLLKKSNGAEISGLQTGAGNTAASLQDPKTSKLVCKENMDEIGKAINILYAMREKIWQALQPRLRCERGKHNSPVLVLPLLVREKPAIKQMFTMNYRYVFKCEKCGYSQDDSHTKILPSIPVVPADFNMKAPCFVRNCFECQAPNQRMVMKFEGLQDFVQMHFVKGLPHNRFDELSFDFNDDHYEVTAVVHYKNNPDHFIAWVRNAPGSTWMECDDLKSVITRYLHVSPNIPPGQVHMVMWERRLTAQHTLVMRDTEDTKLLTSLVLTVQQPNTHQNTDLASRAGLANTPSFPSASTSQTSSLISGQTVPTFAPYTPRGRGRGRGSRGSYGGRGRGAATAMPVRRSTPTITQISTPTSAPTLRARTSPQIVRLPLSALRGAASGGARYVLVSGNSPGVAGSVGNAGTGSGTSKVVVVRSQGGASNISATELLQLLQRSGAISQAGSRITTTINTSTSGATSSTASYIIQPDGSIVSTSSGDTQVQPALEQHPTETAEPSLSDVQSSVEQITESLSAEKEEMQTEEQAQMIPEPEQQISTLPFTPNRELSTANDTIIVSPETGSSTMASSSTDVLGTEQSLPAQRTITLTPSQAQANTYIQIPSASGGMLLTQLTMRGGKMVLVPVDKNTQAQLTSTSVLKLPNTPSGSPKIAIRAGGASPQIISASSAGALLSQLQQQQSQGIISLAQVSSTNSTVSTVTGPRVITIPGNTPGKKTIQVITVPRGANTSQGGTKTILMGSSGIQQTTATSVGESALVEDVLSQSGSIKDTVSTLTSLGSSGQLTSTPAVSLLRDVSARSGASLLTSPPSSQQQKSQESFRYILPGSTTTHVVHTGTGGIQSSLGQAGRAFTALSSSGTIIGGQLTPSPTTSAIGTSPMDQDLALGDSDDSNSASGLLIASQRLSREIIDTTEYIPLGRGRARGRGRGRGRGGRTPRGRGRSQLWSSDADYLTPQIGSRKISTLSADLRQIGAHIIESSSEAVDGVPVVSIPDFNTDEPNQPEHDTVTEPMDTEHDANIHESSVTEMSDLQPQMTAEDSLNQNLTDATLSPTGPRVITQSIPSIKANHGFDILTQGILGGAARSPSMPQVKQARSLLTGSPVSVTHSSLSANSGTTTVLDASSMSAVVSKAQQSLSLGQSVSQSEIDTLIQAAQAAAKPGLSGSTTISFKVKPGVSLLPINVGALGSPTKQDTSFGVEFLNSAENIESKNEQRDEAALQETHTISQEEEMIEKEERIMSVDESQVSAAERYRMPSELFQPDEESPEKPLRLEEGVNKLGSELPSKLFQDSEISSQEEEVILTPPHSHKGAARHKTIKEIEMDKMAMMLANESTSGTKKAQLKGQKLSQPTTKIHGDEESTVGDVDIETSDTLLSQVTKHKRSPSKQKIDHKQRNGSSKKASVKKSVDNDADATSIASAPFNENDTNIVTSPKKDQNSSLNKPKSIGGFATDLLLETENEEKQMEAEQQMETEQDTVVEEVVKSDTVKDSDNKLVDNVETNEDEITEQVLLEDNLQMTNVGENEKVLKEKNENVQPETVVVRRRRIYYPAFVPYKKLRVDWKVEDETEYTDHELQEQCFNYRVLSSKSRAPSLRHPSLGPVQELFITPPSPLALDRPNKVFDNELLPAVIRRRNPKPLQIPVVDPSKEPTVIPLVAEDGDPACTGGSVVTSPNDGEMFSGVIVKKKQEIADWSSSVEEGEDEDSEDSGVEHKYAQREYCKQLLTVLYIEAGDFTFSLSGSYEDDQDSDLLSDFLVKEEESNITADESDQDSAAPDTDDTKQVDVPDGSTLPFEPNVSADLFQDEQGCELPKADEFLDSGESLKPNEVTDVDTDVQTTPVEGSGHQIVSEEIDKTDKLEENLQDSVKETKILQDITTSGETTSQTPVVKKRRGRPSKKHAIKPLLEEDPLAGVSSHIQDVASDPNTPASRINGTDKTSSPQVGLKSEPTSLTKDSTAAPSFPSPSRRSSRTPVPSKRVLDSWEDSSLRTVLKARRTSIVSSDEEHSGSSNGELMVKKIKKQTTLPS